MDKIVTSSSSNGNIIFYDMVGNFIPPEWKNLTSSSGKALSKTSKQILSLIVSRLQSDKFFTTHISHCKWVDYSLVFAILLKNKISSTITHNSISFSIK
ncbi:MAG TPA: hypothetical protein LFW21_05600 [Rickettsia endosymbiont of Pyrocoelia pectoralis]|nr:hypothetical protein [Rickettsia endosymbiont of Pyrocoelia pectoralis]